VSVEKGTNREISANFWMFAEPGISNLQAIFSALKYLRRRFSTDTGVYTRNFSVMSLIKDLSAIVDWVSDSWSPGG
jgi:hypothetical protein